VTRRKLAAIAFRCGSIGFRPPGLRLTPATMLCCIIRTAAISGRDWHERQNIGGPRRVCRCCRIVSEDLRDILGSRGSRPGEKPAVFASLSVFCSLLSLKNEGSRTGRADLGVWPCAPYRYFDTFIK
jgi:hypothetical protein